MFKKKLFIVFEGIDGSGKSLHSLSIIKKLKLNKNKYIYLREPGGSKNAEKIRNLLFKKDNKKFNRLTDTLLYLAARNENILKNIRPNYRKKLIICDRFIDSTLAYQHYGLGVKKDIINFLNKRILSNIKPDHTFLMYLPVSELNLRLSKKTKKNRYDLFNKSFYRRVQRGFMKIAKKNKSKYTVINSLNDFQINH